MVHSFSKNILKMKRMNLSKEKIQLLSLIKENGAPGAIENFISQTSLICL